MSSAPSTPTSINVPSPFPPNTENSIFWSTSTTNGYGYTYYQLERSTNNGSTWTEIQKSVRNNATDTVGSEVSSVKYRVCAYDDNDNYSGYLYSDSITVAAANTPPVITGLTDGAYLGEFATIPRDITYSYTYTNGDVELSVVVTEMVNGVTTFEVNSYSGSQNYFFIPNDVWDSLENGLHTLTLVVASRDGLLSTTCTMTFTKIETEIEFMYKTPISADSMPTKGIYTVEKVTPNNATFSFHVCNNGFDSNPTWEDVTTSVTNGVDFTFTNQTKTASKWGVNILLKVDRNNTVGDCYVSRVQGYFK